jgi:hypothetical protein
MFTVERDAESGEYHVFWNDEDGDLIEEAGPFKSQEEANNARLVLQKQEEAGIIPDAESALDVQIGGGHYKTMKIQPIEFTLANNLGFCEGNVIKYVCRYKDKGGIEDINKAIHYLELLRDSMNNG